MIQNGIIANKDNCLFRQKVTTKFTPKLHKTNTKKKNKKQTNKLASFVKILLLIPAKSPKEAQEILKFFKKNT